MLAVAEQEFLPPGVGLGDVEVHILRSLQLHQDHSPKHYMRGYKAKHWRDAGFFIANPRGHLRLKTPYCNAPVRHTRQINS
jgi:hypothetical protein